MSRSATPREMDMLMQHIKVPMYDFLKDGYWEIKNKDGTSSKVPLASEEELAYIQKYPKFGSVGVEVISMCITKGLTKNPKCAEVFQQIEEYLTSKSIDDREFADIIEKWYNGELCPGYTMTQNNSDFVDYLHKRFFTD